MDGVVVAERYELADLLGKGGMADVYRAKDRVLARDVAVKLLRDTAESETDRLRFTAEARTLAGLNHPGVVMILDAGISIEQPFLVMELVEGPTLGQACAAGTMSPQRVASLGAQLAEAIGYAHGQGIVHRDVKPANVLLGIDDRVKLADFGIARLIGQTVSHTKTGTAVGTAAYLSPEQVSGQEITPATDVYSLGLVLLEALTGERAYPGTPTESALARLSRDPRVPEELPEGLRGLLHEMTALEPRVRPNPRDVADRLRAQDGWPIHPQDAAAPEPSTDGPGSAEPGDGTLVLTQARETLTVTAPSTAAPVDVSGHHVSRIDRPGDWIAGQLRAGLNVLKGMTSRQRALAAVLSVLVALIVVAAFARGIATSADQDPLPRDVPTELEQPLRDLHDAVNGGR
jgi:serine/threonine protein kinase